VLDRSLVLNVGVLNLPGGNPVQAQDDHGNAILRYRSKYEFFALTACVLSASPQRNATERIFYCAFLP
jgi:hypothetical protein